MQFFKVHKISIRGISKNCFERLQVRLLEPPRPAPGLLGRLLSSKEFEALTALVIVANAIFIAYASDLEIAQIGREGSTLTGTCLWVEVLFTAWYVLELAFRVVVLRVQFFLSSDWGWNLFDTVLVLLSLQDIVMSDGTGNPAFLRIMRIGRMLKILRLVRLLRIFRELRLILSAILGCMKSVFWAMLLIVNVSFVFGLCFLQATSDYLREHGDGLDETQRETVLEYWGTTRNSMYTLYAAALGGTDWDVQAKSLVPVGIGYVLLFLVYIGFFYCVVTNTLTSLFVEATMANAQKDQQEVIQAELGQSEVYVQQLRRLFLKFGGQEKLIFQKASGDEKPSAGWRLATHKEVERNLGKVQEKLGELDICMLANNYKVNGHPLGCNVAKHDGGKLQHAIFVKDTWEVTYQDFKAHLADPEMIWFASHLGIEMVNVERFFSVLSVGGTEKVSLEKFVIGCIRLKGVAKSMDLEYMKHTLEQESGGVRQRLTAMESKLEAVASAVGVESTAAASMALASSRISRRSEGGGGLYGGGKLHMRVDPC